MAEPRWRPPEHYVHGVGAPCVVVPARVAAWLERHAGLRQLRIGARGADAEVDAVLVALATSAAAWRASATGSAQAPSAEVVAPLAVMTTNQVADALGVTDRAVRQAISEGRLAAERVGSRWVVNREDFEHFRAVRAA